MMCWGTAAARPGFPRIPNRTKETKTAGGGPAQSRTIQYTYDGLDQLTGVTDQNGTRTYVYDEFQNRIRKEDTEHGVTVYEYDEKKQLVKSIENSQTARTYQYDKQGNLALVEENGEFLQSYTFDSTGMLAEVAGDTEGDSSVLTTYTYDGLGNRMKKGTERVNSGMMNLEDWRIRKREQKKESSLPIRDMDMRRAPGCMMQKQGIMIRKQEGFSVRTVTMGFPWSRPIKTGMSMSEIIR